jgi:hypothetical protein
MHLLAYTVCPLCSSSWITCWCLQYSNKNGNGIVAVYWVPSVCQALCCQWEDEVGNNSNSSHHFKFPFRLGTQPSAPVFTPHTTENGGLPVGNWISPLLKTFHCLSLFPGEKIIKNKYLFQMMHINFYCHKPPMSLLRHLLAERPLGNTQNSQCQS